MGSQKGENVIFNHVKSFIGMLNFNRVDILGYVGQCGV